MRHGGYLRNRALLAIGSCVALYLIPAIPNVPSNHAPRSHMHHRHAAIVMAATLPQSATPGSNGQPGQPSTPKPSVPSTPNEGTAPSSPQQGAGSPPVPTQPSTPAPVAGRLCVRVVDGRTMQPLEGAEVVLIETEQRFTTGKDGMTPVFNAPVLRDPRYRPLVAELHGQLGVVVYKNGYRDSVHLGIRMHEGQESHTTVWMYRLGPGDQRIEPVLYEVPYHHLWLVELADRFRSKTQPGAGPERP